MSAAGRLAAVALAMVTAPATFAAGAAPAADEVTLNLQRIYQPGNRTTKFRFWGTIANGRAGEYVTVLRKPCGSPNTTAIAGATTRGGGVWEAESQGFLAEYDSSTYWARWENRLSDPLVFRGRVPMSIFPLAGSRYRVTVSTSVQSMRGRRIELQRLVGGSWKRASVATLRGSAPRFTATVVATGRNVRYRVHVPAVSARPCYAATSSDPFVVGRPPAPGSSNVIDRTFSCATEVTGGLRMISVSASSARTAYPSALESFSVTTNFVPDWTLVSGHSAGVQYNPKRCTTSSQRPALTSGGLTGGAVSPMPETRYDCEAPSRVLIRLRAVFAAPTKFEPFREFGYPMQLAKGEVEEAAVAVVTAAGRRLAFASFAGGKGRLFTASGCSEDD